MQVIVTKYARSLERLFSENRGRVEIFKTCQKAHTNAGEGEKKREPSYTVGGKLAPTIENSMESP